MKTLEEFKKTGRNVKFSEHPEIKEPGYEFGRVYEGNCYIGLLDSGNWHVYISNWDAESPTLDSLEKELYEFYCEEIA